MNPYTTSQLIDPAQILHYQRIALHRTRGRFTVFFNTVHNSLLQHDALDMGGVLIRPPMDLLVPFNITPQLPHHEILGNYEKWLNELATHPNVDLLNPESAWVKQISSTLYEAGRRRALSEIPRSYPSILNENGVRTQWFSPIRESIHRDRLRALNAQLATELGRIAERMIRNIIETARTAIYNTSSLGTLVQLLQYQFYGQVPQIQLNTPSINIKAAYTRTMRTETMRIFHQAAIQTYRDYEIDQLSITVEYQTQGDDHVCSLCEEYSGRIMTLTEAENLIPIHPNCRCFTVPFTGIVNSSETP
jgi:SPP1 gp7 family putative phage head morphogenesis protein